MECPGGSYSSLTDLVTTGQCTTCPPGSACAQGSIVPMQCPRGTVAAESASAECSGCSGGSFQASSGGTACIACGLGAFCPQGASAALPCPSGRFGNTSDLSSFEQCWNCTSGSSCTTGSALPLPCAAGSVQSEIGRSFCTDCNPGYFQSSKGRVSCDVCPNRTYSSISGAAECNNCLARTSSFPASAECDVCDIHFYRLDAQTEASQSTCVACPEKGMSCPMDTTLETIVVLPGHWRLSGWSREITRCEGNTAAERCIGSPNTSLAAAPRGRLHTPSADGDHYCNGQYSGPECKLCRGGQGLYMHEDSGQCKPCPNVGDRLVLLIGIAALIAAGAGACLVAYFHPASQRFAAVQSARRTKAWLISYAEPIGFQAKLKVHLSWAPYLCTAHFCKASLLRRAACHQPRQLQPHVP